MSSKSVLYFITAFGAAAAVLLFILLTISDDASAQQATAATATPTPAASTPDFPPAPPKRTPPLGNLDSRLSQLASSVQGGYSTAHDAASQAPMHAADSVAVTFYLNGDTAPLLAFLRANGGDPRNIGGDYVEAYVPVSLLAEASEQPNVVRVQAIAPPQPAGKGTVISQGVTAHAANAWHDAGYTGAGVKVGVIHIGFEGFSALMGSELPANVTARCYTARGVFTSNLADCETDGHGTVVSETLLDIAPDATLYIANPEWEDDLKSTVDWLVAQDVDVINMSLISPWGGPGDGTSPDSNSPLNSVDTAVSGGVMWVNSAGDAARDTWFGTFSDPDSDRWMNFVGADEANKVRLEAGSPFQVQLRWNDSWPAANIDLDLHLFDEDGNEIVAGVVGGNNYQQGNPDQIPYERMEYTPTISGLYEIKVRRYNLGNTVPSWVQLQSFTGEDLDYYTERGSISNPAESANPGMLAVGAAHYWDVNTIASYSSRGPTPDDRTKPDIVGVDCAATSTHGTGNTLTSGQRYWFCGTSQSSAHIAGLAALVKQRFSEYTPAQIANYLKSNAEARGAVPNNDWGYGFAKLPSPTDSETPPEPTPVTPEPTPSGTPVTPVPTPSGTPVGGSGGFTQISSGANHACGLRANGSIACWGSNVFGQATPPTTGVFTSISSGDAHTCALRNDGAVVCWGSINNTFTQ